MANEKKFELSTVKVDNEVFAIGAENEGAAIRFTTSYDTVDLFNAVNGGSEKVEDYLDQVVKVTKLIITTANVPEDINDPDGEKISKPCIHFMTADGKHIASVSNGIIRSAKNLIECGLTPTEETPISIKFKTQKTKKGTAYTFDLSR